MHLRKLALFTLLVALLAGLTLWQLGREERRQLPGGTRVLVPDLTHEAVRSVRVDNLERGLQLRLEAQEDGSWRISDPIDFPLESALVPMLMDVLMATPSEAWTGDLAGLGLKPPRAVLEVTQATPGGERVRRIELGAVDVDAQHVFARVDGELVRTLRNLESLLDRPFPEWRSHQVMQIAPTAVVALERSGTLQMPGLDGPVDQALRVVLDGHWRATQPFGTLLAPEAIGPLISSLCYLRVAGFEDDAPRPLEFYGLEPPDIRVSLTTLKGESVALRFAFVPGREEVRCVREGSPNVFNVRREQLMFVFAPAESLVDTELLRAQRERIARFSLLREDTQLHFEREGFGWTLSTSGAVRLKRQKAEKAAVEELLALIERSRVAEVLPGRAFPEGGPVLGVQFEVDDELRGWRLGPQVAGARGTRGRAFLRDGDDLLGLVEDDLSLLETIELDALRSRELHQVSELDLVQAQVRAGWVDARRQWARDAKGRWTPEGSTAEARDFAALVDSLLTVRAASFVDGDETPRGVRPLVVQLLDASGTARAAWSLSLLEGEADAPEAARVLYESPERRAIVDGRLYFALCDLLGV